MATQEANQFNVFSNFGGSYHIIGSDSQIEMSFVTQSYESTFTCEMVKQNGVWVFSMTDNMETEYK